MHLQVTLRIYCRQVSPNFGLLVACLALAELVFLLEAI
jgi:hypothetical protein